MIWVLIPVFNEAEGISSFLKALRTSLIPFGKFSIVLVDDGSSDHSKQVIQNKLLPSDYSIHFEHNKGPGAAFLEGFEFILKKAHYDDSILTLEGDGTCDLNSLKAMFEELKSCDLVLASVYLTTNGFSKTSAWRMFVSKMANGISRSYLKLPHKTLTSFYRLWRVELVRKIKLSYPHLIEEPGFICQVELLYKAKLVGAKIVEVPTRVFSDKRIGKSKMKLINTAISHLRFLLKSNKFKQQTSN